MGIEIEYISKDLALKRFEEIKNSCVSLKDFVYLDGVMAVLDCVPVADVVPVIHGQWEPGNKICPFCKQDKFKDLDADIWADWMPPYCPNCGAKMDR